MSEKTSRGVAVLKLYGPNKAKDYTVMVAKNKDNDNKYVIILAEKILKPLIKKYLSGDVADREEVLDNQYDEVKCPSGNNEPIVEKKSALKYNFCEKTSTSPAGLKRRCDINAQ